MKKFYLFITVILLFSFNNSKALSPGEITALNDLKNAFQPFGWTGSPDCNWPGVYCDANGNVTGLYLSKCINFFNVNTGFQPIPASIGNLVHLESLSFFRLNTSGPLPNSIGNLVNLKDLRIETCHLLSGSIPSSIGNLINLTNLKIYNCRGLTGSIPNTIGNLTNLEKLDIGFCGFTGSIPNTIYNLTKLKRLVLNSNNLTGTISPLIGNLINLTYLGLSYNNLTGSIPSTIGNLNLLNRCYLEHNMLSGTIPDVFFSMTALATLKLNNNNISGKIPNSIFNNNLQLIYLSNNQLDSIHNSSANMPQLLYFEASNNNISYVPPNLRNKCLSLENNYLKFNSIDGTGFPPLCPGINTGYYVPQKKMTTIETKIVSIGNPLVLNSIPLTTPNDQIQWFLNDIPIAGATASTYSIPSVTNANLGLYTYEITNPNVNALTLEIEPILVIDTALNDVPKEYQALFELNLDLKIPFWTGYPSSNWAGISCDANKNVTGINLSFQNLSGSFPSEILNFTKLKSLKIENNNFDYLPDLSSISTLDTLWIHGNSLTFDHILPNVGVANDFHYLGQADILFSYPINYLVCENKIPLKTSLINPNNQYFWTGPRVNGNNTDSIYVIDSINNNTIFFNSIGLYRCRVTNPSLPNLTMYHVFDIHLLTVPVELTYFTANANKEQIEIELNWQTAQEINNSGFEIERSLDGENFEKIAWQDGKGNSQDLIDYQFIDKNVLVNQTYFYRLKQIDFDGAFEYSQIVSARIFIQSHNNVEFVMLPNPAQNTIQIQFSQDLFQPVDLSIFSLDGKLLLSQQIQENNFNFDVSSLSAGIYLIKAKNNNQIITKRLVIQK